MKNKNQTGLKNFKPKINLNHNIYPDHLSVLSHALLCFLPTTFLETVVYHEAQVCNSYHEVVKL